MAADNVFQIPLELADYPAGFTLEIGQHTQTATKVVYRKKDSPTGEKRGNLVLATFERGKEKELWKHLKDNCDIRKNPDGHVDAYTTGAGTLFHIRDIESSLDVTVRNLMEFEASVAGFQALWDALPTNELLYPLPRKPFEECLRVFEGFDKIAEANASGSEPMMKDGRPFLPKRVIDQKYLDYSLGNELYPCIFVTCGAAVSIVRIHQDGTFDMLDVSHRGAKMFMGLGALLTGAKDLDELVSLAEAGVSRKVDMYMRDLPQPPPSSDPEGPPDFASLVPDALLVSCFGKAAEKDTESFAKEDIAAALLNSVCMDIAHVTHLSALAYGARRVIFAGSFVSYERVREKLTKHFLDRALAQRPDRRVIMGLLRHASHIGAIGAWIHGSNAHRHKRADAQKRMAQLTVSNLTA